MPDLQNFTLRSAADELRARRISSLELTEEYLERIDRVNPKLDAYWTISRERALAYGVTTQNPHFGPTPNPWNRSRIPGGSSRTYPPPREVGITHGATQTGTGPTGIQRLEAVQVLRSTQGVCPVRDDLRLAD